jgi:DNA-binding FadR family transcriptional regulator
LKPAGTWDGSIRAPTLASVIARRLEDEVVALGWRVGEVLGSESELLVRFGVSRAVFREAVRVVEHTGAARMRRGPGGGLVVTEPNRSGVVTAMSVWFSYVGVTIDEMLEARLVVLEGACWLAADRPERRERTAEALAAIDELAESGEPDTEQLAGVEGTIAGLAGNPALTLFVEAVADLGLGRIRSGRARMSPPVTSVERSTRLDNYRAVIEAVRSGDGNLAAERIRILVDLLRQRMVDSRRVRLGRGRRADAPGPDNGNAEKMAEAVVHLFRDHIEDSGWPVGQVLGSETDLIDRFGVSRAILREAVRILEHHGAVKTKRGPRGGILVCAPDSAAMVRSARMFLEYEGVTANNLSETRSVIEVAAARLAAERCTPELASNLYDALQREAVSGDAAISFGSLHHVIAEGTGNRLLPLFVDVMGELVPPHLKPERRTPLGQTQLSAEVHRAHERLVRAIAEGDVEQAGRRMKRHMRASAAVFT